MNIQTATTPYFTFESSSSFPYANEQHVLTSGMTNNWAVWDDWFGLSSRCGSLGHSQSSPGRELSEKMNYSSSGLA